MLLSLVCKQRGAPLCFGLEGRALARDSKACYSPRIHMTRRHPKLIIGYRLANHAGAFRFVAVLECRFATDGRSCRPLRGVSRREAMCARIFLSKHQVLYQKRGLCGVSSCLQGPKWDEKRHFGRNMAEEGGTGAKPARGTRGPRVVPAARPESAPYRRLDVGSDTPLAALLTLPRQWTYPPRPAGSTRSAVERRPYRLWNSHWDPPCVRRASGGMAVARERNPPARCLGSENADSGAMA